MLTRNDIIRLSGCINPKYLADSYIRFMLEFLQNLSDLELGILDENILN